MNGKSAAQIIGGAGAGERMDKDFYPTPPDVTIALLDFLNIPKTTLIWEPAAGDGDMINAMTRRGYCAMGSDIRAGMDFFTTDPPDGAGIIITNPPFSAAEGFIRRAADLGLPFAFLLKSQFWHAARRRALFEELTPTYILPLTWRPDFLYKQRGKGSPLMDVMWCVWLLHTRGGGATYIPLKRPNIEEAQGR